jgi:hypothetical protein
MPGNRIPCAKMLFAVLDLPLNPPEPVSSQFSTLIAEVTCGLPVSEARKF